MNLSVESQITKQAELRELRRKQGPPELPSQGRRASKPLEIKWKIVVPRSALCEGCGQRASPAGGSKAWRCGPCVRSLEEAYMRGLEQQEQEHQRHMEETLALGVRNVKFQEELEKSRREVQRLQVVLHENRSKDQTNKAHMDQLLAHLEEQKCNFQGTLELQNEVLRENARLHSCAQEANAELERTGHIARDLEYANQVVRQENQQLQDRVQSLLESIGSLREELRGSFKANEEATKSMAAERRDWQQALNTLQQENEDLRRRLEWLEHQEERKRLSVASRTGRGGLDVR